MTTFKVHCHGSSHEETYQKLCCAHVSYDPGCRGPIPNCSTPLCIHTPGTWKDCIST